VSNMSQESHQQTLNNQNLQEQLKIIPIDWDEILKHTSNIVRQQAIDVVNRMNALDERAFFFVPKRPKHRKNKNRTENAI
jgi:hypothetical protein